MKKGKKERRDKVVFNYRTPSHVPNKQTYVCPLSFFIYPSFLKEKIMI